MSEGHTAPPKDHPSEEEEVDSLIAEEEEDQGLVSQGLANELSKQQELYTDLKRKTQQLKQLQQVKRSILLHCECHGLFFIFAGN